ncbi:MAG TPA: hypothetical protein VGM84_26285 [Steroidobacteraceae bacterium]|jgi:hypothetical protein
MAAKKVSLKALRAHTHPLHSLVDDALADPAESPLLDFKKMREHARGVLTLLGDDDAAPAAATAAKPPHAAAAPAMDRKPATGLTDFSFLGISHIQRGG